MATRAFLIVIALLLLPGAAHAYVGPGAGLGAVAVTLAVLLGVVLLLVGFVWYPLKRLVRRLRPSADSKSLAKD